MRSQPAFVLVPPSEDEEDKHFVLMLRMGDEVFSVGPYLSENEARRDRALALQDARLAGVKPLPQVWRVVASGNLDAVWAHTREQALHLMLLMLGRECAVALWPRPGDRSRPARRSVFALAALPGAAGTRVLRIWWMAAGWSA